MSRPVRPPRPPPRAEHPDAFRGGWTCSAAAGRRAAPARHSPCPDRGMSAAPSPAAKRGWGSRSWFPVSGLSSAFPFLAEPVTS